MKATKFSGMLTKTMPQEKTISDEKHVQTLSDAKTLSDANEHTQQIILAL